MPVAEDAGIRRGGTFDIHGRVGKTDSRRPPQLVRAVTYYYTLTSDHPFVIDRSPDTDHIVFVSACSGHGFKHSAGIGDAVAQLITTGASNIDLKPFTPALRPRRPD